MILIIIRIDTIGLAINNNHINDYPQAFDPLEIILPQLFLD